MSDACDISRCPRCGYDISNTQADGFSWCPECGVNITDLTAIEPRTPPGWSRSLVFLVSVAPMVWIPIGFLFLGGPFGLAGIFSVLVLWPLSNIPVYYTNRALQRWRHPIGAEDRALVRTLIALGLQLLIPMMAFIALRSLGPFA